MNDTRKFIGVLILAFGLPWLLLVVLPYFRLSAIQPVQYSQAQKDKASESGADLWSSYPPHPGGLAQYGKQVYTEEGCAYCHTQVIRPRYAGPDIWRPGWGTRETRPTDFLYDPFALVGILRIGPDLANVGGRFEDVTKLHQYLHSPRSVHKTSLKPSYRSLYKKQKITGDRSDDAIEIEGAPAGYQVVPTYRAKALAAYLLALRKDQPLPREIPPEPAPAAPPAPAETPETPETPAAPVESDGSDGSESGAVTTEPVPETAPPSVPETAPPPVESDKSDGSETDAPAPEEPTFEKEGT